MKICFLTTIVSSNDYPTDTPGKFNPFGNYDFFLFTNLSKEKFKDSKGWTIIKMDDSLLNTYIKKNDLDDKKSNIYKSRYIKFMGWKYLKDILHKDYDVIFYCDSCYIPNHLMDWNHYANIIIKSESGIIQRLHDKKHGPKKECMNIVRSKKDTRENMNKLISFLIENNCKDKKITENTSFGYNPKNKKITDAFSNFWNIYITQKISYRDQPLWGLISQKHNINPEFIDILHRVNGGNKHIMFNFAGKNFSKNKKRPYI
tara:strand:- start:1729 stop:2505 length:777 start_codon:yes stop_codon:yes gene_type:complete